MIVWKFVNNEKVIFLEAIFRFGVDWIMFEMLFFKELVFFLVRFNDNEYF